MLLGLSISGCPDSGGHVTADLSKICGVAIPCILDTHMCHVTNSGKYNFHLSNCLLHEAMSKCLKHLCDIDDWQIMVHAVT